MLVVWQTTLKNKNQLIPKKLSLIEIDRLYRLLRPYLNDDYLEIARQMIYTERSDFYSAINTLCKVTKYDKKDFVLLLETFHVGLEMNEFSKYVSLISEMSNGRPK